VKLSHYVEDFSMAIRRQVNDVHIRHEDGRWVPALNVKPPPLFRRLPAELQAVDPATRELAYEVVRSSWWTMIPQTLADMHLATAFPGNIPEARPSGRSEGWLAVHGIGTPQDWTPLQFEAWEAFASAIAESMDAAELEFHDEIRELAEHLNPNGE
jgi:hypothetical protein